MTARSPPYGAWATRSLTMLQSLRARLAFLFAGTLVLATVIAAVVVVSLYRSYNRDQTVAQLRTQVGGIQSYYQGLFDAGRRHDVTGSLTITKDTFQTVTAGVVFASSGPQLFRGKAQNLSDAGIQPNYSLPKAAR